MRRVRLRTTSDRTHAPPPRPAEGYLHWSRDPSVSLLAVAPLWLCYEALRLTLAPHERNGAEALVTDSLRLLGPHALVVLKVVLGAVFLAAAIHVLVRRVPWVRVALVAAIEGAAYGLILGPVAQVLTLFLLERRIVLAIDPTLASDLIGSLGAGIYEEAVFRLLILSLLALPLARLSKRLGLSSATGVAVAVLLSALGFSAFHHLGGGGEPFVVDVFAFRAVAGMVLGLLFVLRGFGVVVYTHAIYDLHYYLTHG
ncbi:MAG: CPBP family intramembrane metalloprotease [Planctomycetes bacterium]|nr:CPBP family intramembrane metalloprotease [Planctomycetota bacterium]